MVIDEIFWIKVAFMILSTIEAVGLGILPATSKNFKENPKVLGIANAFSGGVFIAISLLHIMPEQSFGWDCKEWKKQVCDKGDPFPLPLPFVLLCTGYILILVLDKVLFDTHAIFGDDHGEIAGGAAAENILKQSVASMRRQSMAGDGPSDINGESVQYANAIKKSLAGSLKRTDVFAAKVNVSQRKASLYEEQLRSNSVAQGEDKLNDTNQSNLFVDKDQKTLQKAEIVHDLIENAPKPTCLDNMTPFVLLIGLSVHSIFEGLALGLTHNLKDLLMFVAAIFLHKGAAGMSLGISMAKTFPDNPRFVIKMIALFGVFTPIGVILGMILQNGSEMTELVFASLAGGTFVYIACSEVIVEEFSISTYRYWKLLAFIVGITIIACLKLLDGPPELCRVCDPTY